MKAKNKMKIEMLKRENQRLYDDINTLLYGAEFDKAIVKVRMELINDITNQLWIGTM